MRHFIQGIFWLGLYVFISLLPLMVVFLGPRPPGRDFVTELSVALGFVGLAMMGLQFFLTARFRTVEAPYGLDVILRFHREISTAAFLIILAHPALLFWRDRSFSILYLWEQPPRAWFAVTSILALTALIVTSVWRIKLKLPYETWRVIHGSLAVVALGFALGHVIGVGHYITDLWQQFLWVLMAGASVTLLLYIRLFKPFSMTKRPYKVTNVEDLGGQCWSIRCVPDGHEGFEFKAGQFAWLTLWGTPFAIEEHPFSMTSSSLETDYVEFGIKELGDFTSHLGELPEGSTAYIDGPYGAFTFERYPAAGYVMIAGGIGITPIMSMLRTLADYEDTRPVLLIFAATTFENLTFYDEIEALKERLPHLNTVYVVNEAAEDWEGETGFVDAEMLCRYLPEHPWRHQYFLCGPWPMLFNVEQALLEVDVPNTHIHAELFNLV